MQSYKKNEYDAILHEIFFSNVAKIYYPRVASKLLTCRQQTTNVSLAIYTLVNRNLLTCRLAFTRG